MIYHSRQIYIMRCLSLVRKLAIELYCWSQVDKSALVATYLNQVNSFFKYLNKELEK